jgi:hypothetical protein
MSLTATPERLVQTKVDPQNTHTTYSVTAHRAVLRDIIISRTDDTTTREYVTISVIPSGENYATRHDIYTRVLLRAYETVTLSAARPVVHAGDQIRIHTTGGFVNCYISGGAYEEVV